MKMIRFEKLEAGVMYGVMECCRDNKLPDMFLALAQYIYESGRTELLDFYHDYRWVWVDHGDRLIDAFPDREEFEEAFAAAIAKYEKQLADAAAEEVKE